MLRRISTDSSTFTVKGAEAMKHKIRNLRAKLKTLLSSDSCTKYSKRSKQVMKMQQLANKQFFLNNAFFNQSKHLFTYTKEQPKNYWYSQKHQCNVMHVFGKLTKQEIQQIQEDMIYYLGEEHVEQFKEFTEMRRVVKAAKKENYEGMRRLKTSNQNLTSTERNLRAFEHQTERKESTIMELPRFNKDCSIAQNFFSIRPSVDCQPPFKNRSSKRLKTSNLIESRASTVTKRSTQKQRVKFQANFLGNRENFLKNRKMIEEESNAQRFLTKVTLEMKQQKATDIMRMTQQAFISTIKVKNTNNDSRTKKMLEQKYKKNVTFGSIVELNEELRKIYIKKISENAKGELSEIPEERLSDKDKSKPEAMDSIFFAQAAATTNSHYRSKY